MTPAGLFQLALFCLIVVLAARPLGSYIARVYDGSAPLAQRLFGPGERLVHRTLRLDASEEMTWTTYASAVGLFNAAGFVVVYALQRFQGWLPGNPASFGAISPDASFNTAISFVTNTNWQAYAGEAHLAYLTQMLGLTVQNFVSAATGMAVLVALIRGLRRTSAATLGNFWVDLVRSTLYVLLPLSFIGAIVLVSQGVVQTLEAYPRASLLDGVKDSAGAAVTGQVIAVGPAASQVMIKSLGSNGGGFFGANAAHPFENPTALSNLVECLSILLLPVALCQTFGVMVRDVGQGKAILTAMAAVFLPLLLLCTHAEQSPNPALASLSLDHAASALQAGGNMEGKETRFGIANSALWATATTSTSNGGVNSMHDSFTPLGGLVPMWLMQLGEVVFGGVGSGLYGMLMFVIITVFVAGLLVGRTPEYLGKKIETYEMKMASLVVLIPPFLVLAGTAVACSTSIGRRAVSNPSPHGFSEILYAFSSAANNNGSAFAGLDADNVFYNVALGVCMWFARFGIIVPVLAIAGSLARKRKVPKTSGTLETHSPLFVAMLVGTIILVGALTFIPALALGPIVEHLTIATHGSLTKSSP